MVLHRAGPTPTSACPFGIRHQYTWSISPRTPKTSPRPQNHHSPPPPNRGIPSQPNIPNFSPLSLPPRRKPDPKPSLRALFEVRSHTRCKSSAYSESRGGSGHKSEDDPSHFAARPNKSARVSSVHTGLSRPSSRGRLARVAFSTAPRTGGTWMGCECIVVCRTLPSSSQPSATERIRVLCTYYLKLQFDRRPNPAVVGTDPMVLHMHCSEFVLA